MDLGFPYKNYRVEAPVRGHPSAPGNRNVSVTRAGRLWECVNTPVGGGGGVFPYFTDRV